MKAKEQQEALDNLIKQTLITDSLYSFSKTGESSVQWIHWLDIIDQQSTNKGLKNSKLELGLDAKDCTQQELPGSDIVNGEGPPTKEFGLKGGNMYGRGLQASADKFHPLKFPEAMVAFAQAAAKDLPGWPLMSNKVQMHKCEKCSQEFCSPLNLRRHMRTTHRRPLNADKEDMRKKKEQVGAYWDKLSSEQAGEIISFKNISLEDLSAASIVRALSSHLQQPSLLCLPQSYIKVATTLLDIVQNKPSKVPLQSEELFSILDDASEKNLFCGVTSTSMQRCIFDSEPGRVGLESKNLVAALGFLVELRLVKAWMDDKDMEALRCQKALVEEEEAAQKKRAKLQERKRQKKMRQKELKDKDRKATESSSLQTLKFDSLSGENGKGEGVMDDSPTATQSSPSSSVYSGQETILRETSEVDGYELEGGNNGNVQTEHTVEQYVNHEGHGQDNPSYMELSGADGDDSAARYSNHDDYQDMADFADQRGEDGKYPAYYRPTGNDRKFAGGWGWRERRPNDHESSSYQKQPYYTYGRRYYDNSYDYSYGGQRNLRRSHNMLSGTAADPPGGPAHRIPTPRYGQYRERYSGVKRPSPNAGPSHAVWARKASQTPLSESQPDGKSATADEPANGLELSKGAENIPPVSPEKQGGLSRDSSRSFDSVTSYSSVSVSARIGVEEQTNSESIGPSVNTPAQAICDSLSDTEGAAGLVGNGISSGALVVGSVTIPLGSTWPIMKTRDIPEVDVQGENKLLVNGPTARERESQLCLEAALQGASALDTSSELSTSPKEAIEQGGSDGGLIQSNLAAERTAKQIHWQNNSIKAGITKVWRPVTPGDRHDTSVGSTASECVEQVARVTNINSSSGEETRSTPAECGSEGSFQQQLARSVEVDTLSQADFHGTDLCGEGGHGMILEASYEEVTVDSTSRCCLFADLASFLAQRWVDAISSSDSVEVAVHLGESEHLPKLSI